MVIFSCSDMCDFDVQLDVAAESYHKFNLQDAQHHLNMLTYGIDARSPGLFELMTVFK